MDRLTALGTGNAAVTRCYNTCFLLDLPQGYLLCDAGGGNGILSQLEKAGVDLAQIHHLILTHAHSDHLLGAVWVVRMVAAAMNAGRYEGELTIWCDPSVREGLCQMARITLQKKMTDRLGDRILFHDISDGQTDTILGRKVTFFDIHSTKMKQMGFTMELAGGGKLCCLGDEPYNPACAAYVGGADWLLCEAFCLYEDRERFKPIRKAPLHRQGCLRAGAGAGDSSSGAVAYGGPPPCAAADPLYAGGARLLRRRPACAQ